MAFSVSMVREVQVEGAVVAEVALQIDARDLVVFRFDTGAEASTAGNALRAAVVSARDVILNVEA